MSAEALSSPLRRSLWAPWIATLPNTAIAATGAIAVFGSVAIQGAHSDLLKGLDNASADMWVSPAGTSNLVMPAPFAPAALSKLAKLPGVRAVRSYRGGLLDYT